MQNIVVLGASNSRMPNSFYAGICGEEEGEFKVHNLSVGGSESLHKVYLLYNEKYKELIKNADLLILETSLMDESHHSPNYLNVDFNVVERRVKWFYEEIYRLGKTVLACILFSPYTKTNSIVYDLHEKLCRHYGFNFINFHQKILDWNLHQFCASRLGGGHILFPIMYEFGKNIRLNFKNFLSPKKEVMGGGNPEFVVVLPQELNSNLNEGKIRDLNYTEKIFWLKENDKFIFPKKYHGFELVGINSCTPLSPGGSTPNMYSSLIFQNKTTKIVKPFRSYNNFTFLFKANFLIDEETFIKENTSEEMTELSDFTWVKKGKPNTLNLEDKGTRLVGFLLANTKNSRLLDEKDLNLQNSEIYDFTHLVPPIDLYKDIIESFIIHNRLLSEAEFKAKFKPQNTYENSAKARIHRHLAYKLGAAMVRNSKSFLGILKMPFVLISLAISHQEELKSLQGVKPAPLETCSDYNEALKEKECFTYKLGLAFIKANKNLLKGGHFKFFFKDLPKLKRELKAKKLKLKKN